LFWTTADLENKLLDFRTYFNNHRTHDSLEGRTPDTSVSRPIANLRSIRWQPNCRALYQTPVAAGLIRDSPWLQYSVDLGRTSKKSFAVFLLQRASPIGSIPCYRRVPKVELITLSQRDER
jgi:hypothetical protein